MEGCQKHCNVFFIGPPNAAKSHLLAPVIAISYALFVLAHIKAGPEMTVGEREKFVPLPDISPVTVGLDPRTEPDPTEPGSPSASARESAVGR